MKKRRTRLLAAVMAATMAAAIIPAAGIQEVPALADENENNSGSGTSGTSSNATATGSAIETGQGTTGRLSENAANTGKGPIDYSIINGTTFTDKLSDKNSNHALTRAELWYYIYLVKQSRNELGTESQSSTGSGNNTVNFSDVNSDAYYYDAVQWAVYHNYIQPVSDTVFSPGSEYTYGMLKGEKPAEETPTPDNNSGSGTDVSGHSSGRSSRSSRSNRSSRTRTERAATPTPAPETKATVTPAPEAPKEVSEETSTSFTDVPASSYYAKAVSWAEKKGITSGYGDGKFHPKDACTRGQMVEFLYRLAGSPDVSENGEERAFTDVSSSAFYRKALIWALQNHIAAGTSDSKFSPDMPCTRGQMAAFLFRMAKAASDGSDTGFTDVDSNSYYADAIAWLKSKGITSGTTSSTFSPNRICSRGEMVTFLYRYDGNV